MIAAQRGDAGLIGQMLNTLVSGRRPQKKAREYMDGKPVFHPADSHPALKADIGWSRAHPF